MGYPEPQPIETVPPSRSVLLTDGHAWLVGSTDVDRECFHIHDGPTMYEFTARRDWKPTHWMELPPLPSLST
jgi:hypothetical protein